MYEFAVVLLFTAAGGVAAMLALRASAGSAVVRWLAGAFILMLTLNLGLYVWPAIASDVSGAARKAAIAAVIVLAVIAYARLLRAARRAHDRRGGR